ncbi:MAG: M1 family aminopeptidase [Candidatus Sulfotelmatobacter sp.]
MANCFALDREAFTFTRYDLNVRVEPEQQRLGVRGKITLRNDSSTPQKIAVLQISSSLDWRSIKAGDKPLQFVAQAYTSDIDHTGALSEAVVTLPESVAPKGKIELEIAYEGVIVLDATRLTRIGAPEEAATSSDWDEISAKFTAVRGAGYVAWYPIATEAADLSESENLFEVLGRWKAREAASTMIFGFAPQNLVEDAVAPVTLCGGDELHVATPEGSSKFSSSKCSYQPLGLSIPVFVVANYGVVDRSAIAVYNLPEHAVAAEAFADAAEKTSGLITDWFGAIHRKAETADLVDPTAAAFESGSLLLTPLANADPKLMGLIAAHQLTHAAFSSPRPWINEGVAHFAQALYLEHQSGRQAALDYLAVHRAALTAAENEKAKQTTPPRSEDEVNRSSSLVNTADEELYRSKAMCVWWMLRDMIGDAALKKALASYRPEDDKEPSYMPRLIQAQTQRDLEWFFDDWVYRDRGLPDFKIESVFPRKTMNDEYLVTVTVENRGRAGAEVPIIVKFAGGEMTKRLEVRGGSKGVVRVDISKPPDEVVVNDGSVPESEMKNNVFKVEAGEVTADPAQKP